MKNLASYQKMRSWELKTRFISDMQKKAFTEEYKMLQSKKQLNKESGLLVLNPFIDEDNIMKANTRLKYAKYLPYDTRFPIILPRGMWVTKLIVRSYHIKDGHESHFGQFITTFLVDAGESGDTASRKRVQYMQSMQSQNSWKKSWLHFLKYD